MARIVAVHGIAQQFKGSNTLHDVWLPALRDGLDRVGVHFPNPDDLVCVFYGHLFRKKGTKSLRPPLYEASDVDEGFEQDLLALWWQEAARLEQQVPDPDLKGKGRTSKLTQRALNALSKSEFFSGLAERVMIGDMKQVRRYMQEESTQQEIQAFVSDVVQPDTRVLIGHSLGSVVAYEALCAHPEWNIQTFVTLGSPLGIPNLIFDRLRPPPVNDVGVWPGNVKQWINIADDGDVVALEKNLSKRFGDRVQDERIHNGATAHDISPYLTAEETGRAIATGLS